MTLSRNLTVGLFSTLSISMLSGCVAKKPARTYDQMVAEWNMEEVRSPSTGSAEIDNVALSVALLTEGTLDKTKAYVENVRNDSAYAGYCNMVQSCEDNAKLEGEEGQDQDCQESVRSELSADQLAMVESFAANNQEMVNAQIEQLVAVIALTISVKDLLEKGGEVFEGMGFSELKVAKDAIGQTKTNLGFLNDSYAYFQEQKKIMDAFSEHEGR